MNLIEKYKIYAYLSIIDFRINEITHIEDDYFPVEKMALYALLVNMPFILMMPMGFPISLMFMVLCLSIPACFAGIIMYMVNAHKKAENILLKYIKNTSFSYVGLNDFYVPQFQVGKYIISISYGCHKVYGGYCFVKYGNGKIMCNCIDDTIKMRICKLLDPDLKYYTME